MSKAFTKETDTSDTEDDQPEADALPPNTKNYMTPQGFVAMQEELRQLMRVERPKIVEIVSWAAGNGDRSENGDYLYGKKRLREIDRRVRYITKRLDNVQVVDPTQQQGLEQVFFGATVTYAREDDSSHTVTLVGIDEADATHGKISWLAPISRALMKSREGDMVSVATPAGKETLEVVKIEYRLPDKQDT